MGLDIVEVILRTEEVFSIDLPNHECDHIILVGDLYRLVLAKLNLPYVPASEIDDQAKAGLSGRDRLRAFRNTTSWSSSDVWVTLRSLISDQLQVDLDEIRESVSFLVDLGCD